MPVLSAGSLNADFVTAVKQSPTRYPFHWLSARTLATNAFNNNNNK